MDCMTWMDAAGYDVKTIQTILHYSHVKDTIETFKMLLSKP